MSENRQGQGWANQDVFELRPNLTAFHNFSFWFCSRERHFYFVAGSHPNNHANARRDTIFLPVNNGGTRRARARARAADNSSGMRLQHREEAARWRRGRRLGKISVQTRHCRHRIVGFSWSERNPRRPVVQNAIRHLFGFDQRRVFLLPFFLLSAVANHEAHRAGMFAVKSPGHGFRKRRVP